MLTKRGRFISIWRRGGERKEGKGSKVKWSEGKGNEVKEKDVKGREVKGREGKWNEGKWSEGKGCEGKCSEGKGCEGKWRGGKGRREGKGNAHKSYQSILVEIVFIVDTHKSLMLFLVWLLIKWCGFFNIGVQKMRHTCDHWNFP